MPRRQDSAAVMLFLSLLLSQNSLAQQAGPRYQDRVAPVRMHAEIPLLQARYGSAA